MNCTHMTVPIRQLIEGFEDTTNNRPEGSVTALGGRLNVRPPYQRQFVYDDVKRANVIRTIMEVAESNVGAALGAMHWQKVEGGLYEIVDGQQRTISICQFADNQWSVDGLAFHMMENGALEAFLNLELHVCVYDGDKAERIEVFERINIAGEEQTEQEMRNHVYAGRWLTDAQGWFSFNNCQAQRIAGKYVKGSAVRQEILEAALKWTAQPGESIEDAMARRSKNRTADNLWAEFKAIIEWWELVFPTYNGLMKGLDLGGLHREHGDRIDLGGLDGRVSGLLADEEVTRKRGIWEHLLTGENKHLYKRSFSDAQKRTMYERQEGVCPLCPEDAGRHEYKDMEGDHVIPYNQDGPTTLANGRMLCRACNNARPN